MALPECFCWTRFGTEAAQPVTQILARKERERVANGGIFIWGIGNAIRPSIIELVRRQPKPEIVFSPIQSRPKLQDVSPPALAAWGYGENLDGGPYHLPAHSLVMSRYDPEAPKATHYALVCSSRESLLPLRSTEAIAFGQLRNMLTGRPVGASQVTAVVHCGDGPRDGAVYNVAIRAQLVYPYFVRLRHPLVLSRPGHSEPISEEERRELRHRLSEQFEDMIEPVLKNEGK